jgi:hypothetical protein
MRFGSGWCDKAVYVTSNGRAGRPFRLMIAE